MNAIRDDFLKIKLHTLPPFSDFDKVCRICLKTSRLRPIFMHKHPNPLSTDDIAGRIKKCLGIAVKLDDGLPHNMCYKCINVLHMAYHIKILSKKSDVRLRRIFEATGNRRIETESATNFKSIADHECEKRSVKIDDSPLLSQASNKTTIKSEVDDSYFDNEGNSVSAENDDYICQMDRSQCEANPDDIIENEEQRKSREKSSKIKRTKCGKTGGINLTDDLTFFECLLCEMQFPSKKSLVLHMAEIHGDVESNEHRCYGCDKLFDKRPLMIQHEKKHCPKMPPGSTYQCRKCPAQLRSRKALDSHMQQHDGASWKTLELDKLYVCPICQESLKSLIILRNHMKYKHSDNAVELKCPTCNKSMVNKAAMYSHMKIHKERIHVCDQCDYRTNLMDSLILHKRKHSGERPYACEWCGHGCISISNLIRHQMKHTGVKNYECKECDKKYKDKKTLQNHISSFHLKLRPHFCDKCGLNYARRNNLRYHIRNKHSEDVPSPKR